MGNRKEPIWNPRLTGRIAYVEKDKGYGRVRQTDDGPEYFFHQSAVVNGNFRRLKSGDAVTFEPNLGDPALPLAARLAYQSLVDQGAEPGKATRERAQSIVATWQAATTPTTQPTALATPGMTQHEIRQTFACSASLVIGVSSTTKTVGLHLWPPSGLRRQIRLRRTRHNAKDRRITPKVA
jgi:cold shock CspA family protein